MREHPSGRSHPANLQRTGRLTQEALRAADWLGTQNRHRSKDGNKADNPARPAVLRACKARRPPPLTPCARGFCKHSAQGFARKRSMMQYRGPLSFMRNCKGNTSPGVAVSAVQSERYMMVHETKLRQLRPRPGSTWNTLPRSLRGPSRSGADRDLKANRAVGRLEPELHPMPELQTPRHESANVPKPVDNCRHFELGVHSVSRATGVRIWSPAPLRCLWRVWTGGTRRWASQALGTGFG